jgi:hypothetical protein
VGLLNLLYRQTGTSFEFDPVSTTGKPPLELFKRKIAKGELETMSIDATISETHTSTVELSPNPIETGEEIIDHAQVKPKEFYMEGVISDTPIGFLFIGNAENAIRQVGSLFGRDTRSIAAYKKLVALQESRQPFTVITGLRRYENMLIEKIVVPRTVHTSNAIHFQATLREVKRVTAQTTTVSANISTGARAIGSKTKEAAAKVTEPVAAAKNVDRQRTIFQKTRDAIEGQGKR